MPCSLKCSDRVHCGAQRSLPSLRPLPGSDLPYSKARPPSVESTRIRFEMLGGGQTHCVRLEVGAIRRYTCK